MKNPSKKGNVWEFPLHIMDGWVIERDKRWQSQTLQQAIESTKRTIEEAAKNDLKYISVLFHDRYFCDSYRVWKEWYIWLINWFVDNKIEFIDHQNAILELEKKL